MCGAWRMAAALLLGMLSAGAARAGVYSADDQPEWPMPSPYLEAIRIDPAAPPLLRPSPFQVLLGELRTLPLERLDGATSPDARPVRFRRRVAAGEARARDGLLTDEERVSLGAAYIRLMKYEQAVQILTPAARDRKNFMALANLATASHLAGRLDRALSYQRQALDAWPEQVPGWSGTQLVWYRRVEKYYLTLLQARYQESLRPTGKEGLDPLFPGVRFSGRDGYQAGEIAPEQLAEVPADALAVVEHLVLWLPQDNRLYWLFAELLNASGRVIEAADVMDELSFARAFGTVPEFQQHRRVLLPAREVRKTFLAKLGRPEDQELLLGAFLPRGFGLPPLAGEAGWVAVIHQAERAYAVPPLVAPAGAAAGDGGGTATPWMPQWRQIGVGFAAGVLIALLAVQQVRQARRRRR